MIFLWICRWIHFGGTFNVTIFLKLPEKIHILNERSFCLWCCVCHSLNFFLNCAAHAQKLVQFKDFQQNNSTNVLVTIETSFECFWMGNLYRRFSRFCGWFVSCNSIAFKIWFHADFRGWNSVALKRMSIVAGGGNGREDHSNNEHKAQHVVNRMLTMAEPALFDTPVSQVRIYMHPLFHSQRVKEIQTKSRGAGIVLCGKYCQIWKQSTQTPYQTMARTLKYLYFIFGR